MNADCETFEVKAKIPHTSLTVVDGFLDPPMPEEEIDRIHKIRDKSKPGLYNWALKEDLPKVSAHLTRFYKRAVEVMGLDETQIVGVEFWINIFGPDEGIHMHADIDETLQKD